ncbi:MAG TPA: lipopolysaccharide heptosyltransferase II [Blastocatellia bacterium]|nr:lipopolysaccharide heptosyltransferase II [Blastocatellia bacterium]
MPNSSVERIIIRGTNWLGDAVMTTPALRRLRSSFPAAHIVLLATPRTADLFIASSFVDEVALYRRREEGVRAFTDAVRMMRRNRFDLALLFQNAFEAALLAWLGGAALRIGFAAEGRGTLLTHALHHTPEHRNRHQTQDYLDIVIAAERACGLKIETTAAASHPSITAATTHLAAAEALLQRHQITTREQQLIALNAGATNSRAKCWPEDRFAALADRLIDNLNARVILIGAPSERDNAARVIAQMKHAGAINLAGETSMTELIGVLDRCDLLITNDTGPAHIAAALGKPTLTIFGPTNEFETAPLGPRAEVIRAEGIQCARCMHRDCPIDHRCMTRIAADEVAERAMNLLRQTESEAHRRVK